MEIVATAYKNSGKFYEEVTLKVDPTPIYRRDLWAKILYKKIPFLEGGFVHVRTSDKDTSQYFCNNLFRSSDLLSVIDAMEN